ncbi:MAG: CDP-diacylglycerol--serine O-phosphatidyltransferase [Candidatus Methanoperedens sp.]|nr:CDP-diacylglycerol--serine O-phosphatidyltransferase [Candidatus Methanoperedens sp.]
MISISENILKLIRPADIATLINALLGFASIIMIFQGMFDSALVLILLAVIADAADGAVARYSGFGVLGANLDSLSDAISFGAAPAVAAFVFLIDSRVFAWFGAGLFLVCGILRLARFNVAGKKDGFEGIPITSGGFMVALFLLAKDYLPDSYVKPVFVLFIIIISVLMVSTISYPKLKSPVILAPVGILLVLDIMAFYLGYIELVRPVSLVLFAFVFVYILSPIGRRIYGRSE